MDLVSIIIPTYNRYNSLINAINSVKNQTYKNIEIIVVNDCSTQKDYENLVLDNIKIINLEKNTREIFNYACAAYTRTIGIKNATGKYIAFLDDDDSWLPNKLELQINAIKNNNNCKMSATEGYIGRGIYNENTKYPKFLNEYYYKSLKNKYKNTEFYDNNLEFPKIWNLRFIRIHNCIATSSVVVEKELLEKLGYMESNPPPGEDYACWLKLLQKTNLVYINEPCFFYDLGHGGKRWW